MIKGLFTRASASGHGGPSDLEITPQFMPGTATDMCTDDIHITEIVLTNTHTDVVTVRFRDKQATAVPLLPDDMSLTAGSVVSLEFPRGALMVGGVSWSASMASKVAARVRGF